MGIGIFAVYRKQLQKCLSQYLVGDLFQATVVSVMPEGLIIGPSKLTLALVTSGSLQACVDISDHLQD